MFKTAKNTIKKAAKDQVEFFLVLLTGVFAGSIFTLAYVKYDVKTSISFADIGGMLAGVSTAGLLYVAIRTAKNWRTQLQETAKRESNDQLYEVSLQASSMLSKFADCYSNARAIAEDNKAHGSNSEREMHTKLKALDSKLIEISLKYQTAKSKLEAHWADRDITEITSVDFILCYEKIKVILNRDHFDRNGKTTRVMDEFSKIHTEMYFKLVTDMHK
jgi:hypothetical protein